MADEEMAQVPPSEKEGLKRGVWSPEEDAKLVSFINTNGLKKWHILPQEAGLNRCGKSCRLRWLNYLHPDLKRGNFTHDEEETIIRLHNSIGNKWSQIAAKLPGRTDNEIKNIWNKRLRVRAESMKAEQANKRLRARAESMNAEQANKRLKAHAESLESMRVEHSRYSYSYSCWCTYSYTYSYSYVSLSSSLNSSNSNWNGESAEELGESKQLMLNEENEEDENLYEGLLNLPSQRDLAISDIFEDGADCVSSPKWIQDNSSNMQVTSSDK